ncbi:MAG TPA: hypothetical protein VFL93_09535 [Longimicrobiaceae bacterium]|nr:hypothetical protein [Longimicrobiaceae bacterium]
MPHWTFALRLVILSSLGMLLLLVVDFLARAGGAWRRRKEAQGGVYGVVVDRDGRTLATYVDPLHEPHRAIRVHRPGSVWVGEESEAWAWEGQAATEEEARHLANRVRHLHLSLLPELRAAHGSDDSDRAEPWHGAGPRA